MRLITRTVAFIFSTLIISSSAISIPDHINHLELRASNFSSKNTPETRATWGEYSIDDDYYETWPETGVTREYWLSAEQIMLNPDGYEKEVQVFNGSLPGPTIEADWGDDIVVHIINNLPDNGTSIHWHGIRMLNNTQNDGTPGVTQCPIAPGDTMTYRFKATQ